MCPEPPLTPTERAELQAVKDTLDAGIAGVALKNAAIQQGINAEQNADNVLASRFNWVNNCIRAYELEVRWMNGYDVTLPIQSSDVVDFANNTGRLVNGTDLAPFRISQFDGSPLAYVDNMNETYQIPLMAPHFTVLQTGLSATLLVGATLASSITEASTSFQTTSTAVAAGQILIIHDTTKLAVVHVDSVTPPVFPAVNYVVNYTLQQDSSPTFSFPSTTPIGLDGFTGFSNADRTTHVASTAWQQDIMNNRLNQLTTILQNRLTVINNEITAIQGNFNTGIDPNALTNAQASKNVITTALGLTPPSTLNITDAGITNLQNDATTRQAWIPNRVTAIAAEIAASSFYDARYNYAVCRSHHGNGTLYLINLQQQAQAGNNSGATIAGEASSRYASILV